MEFGVGDCTKKNWDWVKTYALELSAMQLLLSYATFHRKPALLDHVNKPSNIVRQFCLLDETPN